MKECLLIDEIFLKENSSITANVDAASLFPHIRTAQDIQLQELIGTSLLKYLCDLLSESPVNIQPVDEVLIKLCRQTLVWWSVYEFIPNNWIAIRNAGLLQQYSDNTNAVDQAQMEYMRNDVKTKAVFYGNRLVSYLCGNGNKYAAYNKGCWSCGDISPAQKKGNSTDLFFDEDCGSESRQDELMRKAGLKR